MPSHDPAERSQIATIGAYGKWAKELNRTAAARAALEAKFLAEADGDPKRAEALRRLYYLRLARKSAEARRVRKAAS